MYSWLLMLILALPLTQGGALSLSEEELERMILERARRIVLGTSLTGNETAPLVNPPQGLNLARPAVGAGNESSLQSRARRLAAEIGIAEHLALGLIQIESGWNPRAVSDKDARGLAQVLPSTARGMGFSCDLFEPECNLKAGFTYLRAMLDTFGDPRLALAAYNAGPGVFGKTYSLEVRNSILSYVRNVVGAANRYRQADR